MRNPKDMALSIVVSLSDADLDKINNMEDCKAEVRGSVFGNCDESMVDEIAKELWALIHYES